MTKTGAAECHQPSGVGDQEGAAECLFQPSGTVDDQEGAAECNSQVEWVTKRVLLCAIIQVEWMTKRVLLVPASHSGVDDQEGATLSAITSKLQLP